MLFKKRSKPAKVVGAKHSNSISEPKTVLKTAIAIYPGVAAVILAFFKDSILRVSREAAKWTADFFGVGSNEETVIVVLVILYWFLLGLWIFFYFRTVLLEKNANKQKAEDNKNYLAQIQSELNSAIFRAPNPKIFTEFIQGYNDLEKEYFEILSKSSRKELEVFFQKFLENICKLTTLFLNNPEWNVIYGANLMLYVPSESNEDLVEKLRSDDSKCFHFSQIDRKKIVGVLVGVNDLMKTAHNGGAEREIPEVVLPIISWGNRDEDEKMSLPGAPRAYLKSTFIFPDVRDMSLYEQFDKKDRDAAERYWNEKATQVRSVASFAIPHRWDFDPQTRGAVGVLNIDSTEKNVLGEIAEYNATFISLLTPMLYDLAPILYKYYLLYIGELKDEGSKEKQLEP